MVEHFDDDPGGSASRYSLLCFRLQSVVDRALANCRDVALLDYPDYENPGDSAIWLGTKTLLRTLGCRVRYSASIGTYDPESCRRSLSSSTAIVIQGSGGFGDLYPAHQQFREAVLSDFPDRKIICMPQTVFFRDSQEQDDSLGRFASHDGAIVLARGVASFSVLREHGVRSAICPDPEAALKLRRQNKKQDDPSSVLFLLRKDMEGKSRLDWVAEGQHGDWLDYGVRCESLNSPRFGIIHLASYMSRHISNVHEGSQVEEWCRGVAFDRRASRAVKRAIGLIDRYETVVTDRLHGLLLALNRGKRVVSWDSGYGKLQDYVETFLKDEPMLTFCSDPSEVEAVLQARGVRTL